MPLPIPTFTQMQQFLEFVSNAHSWYKHLPDLPPGLPFQFFLDPAAGMQLIELKDGTVQAIPRAERGFHYSWLPTAEYRDRFGYLAYSQSSGTAVSFRTTTDDRFVGSDHYPTIYDPDIGRRVHLPGEALEAGQTFVTAIIHENGTDYRRWEAAVERTRGNLYWPEESGGLRTAAQIVAHCRILADDQSQAQCVKLEDIGPGQDLCLMFMDEPLCQLLEPERQRQQRGMLNAMTQLVKLVWQFPSS